MLRMSVHNIKPGSKVGKSVYSADGRVLLAAGQEIKKEYVDRLIQLGIFSVYIDDDRTKDVMVLDVISEESRREATYMVMETMQGLEKKRQVINVRGIKDVINNIIDELVSQKKLVVNLMDIRSYDDYIYNHSVGVCILSLTTGISLNYDPLKLRDLGVGALLHDVGKVKISPEILNKPGKYTPEEFDAVKKHVDYGFEMLRGRDDMSIFSAHVAYQHHERVNGNGYSRGLGEKDITEFAKIAGIADVYDALTADRVYRKKFLPHEALELIQAEVGTQFDPRLVNVFFDNIAIYPVGTMLELNTGEKGVVIEVEKGLSQRPTVRILTDSNGGEVPERKERNLIEELTVFVTRVLE